MQSILKDSFSRRAALFFMLPLFVAGVVFSMPGVVRAQATPAAPAAATPDPSVTTDVQKQATIDSVKSAVGMPTTQTTVTATDVKGMSSCTGSTVKVGACGEVASDSGHYGNISIAVGDVVKCAGVVTISCAITNAQGTSYTASGVTGNDTVQTDTQGNIVGGGSQGLLAAAKSTVASAAANVVKSAAEELIYWVGDAILRISTFFLGIAGVLFNLTIVKTVFQFSTIVGNAPGLLLAWGILRDIGNMALLFGFIFMGLATILDLHTYNAKKALPPLIIFAVLMNFSLFAAEAIIDTSNAFASILYSQANTGSCGNLSSVINASTTSFDAAQKSDAECSVNYGIGGSIMQVSGLSTMFTLETTSIGTASIAVYVGLALFAIIGAIVMLAASIMLIIRVVTLTLLMVFAPIGFAGMAIPPLQGLASKWWSMLIHQSFFAPLLLLLIFISLKVTEGLSTVKGSGLAGALTAPDASAMGVILVFVIVIGFLVGSLKAASSFGAMGASMAISAATKIVRTPLGGISGFAGRNTIGKAGGAVQKKYESWMGKEGGNKLLRSTIRNVGLDTAVIATTDGMRNAKYGGSESQVDRAKRYEHRTGHLAHAGEAAALSKELDEAITEAQGAGGNVAAAKAAEAKVARVLQRMNIEDINKTKYVKKAADGIELLARSLSPEKFEEYVKSKDVEADKKEEMIHERFSSLQTSAGDAKKGFAAGASAADQAKARAAQADLRKWSPKDLELLAKYQPDAYEKLIEIANPDGDSVISDDQFDVLQKSNTLSNIQKQQTKDNSRNSRVNRLLDTAGGTRVPSAAEQTEAVRIIARIAGNKNKAKLSADVLTNSTVANSLDPAALGAIMTEDKLNTIQAKALAAVVHARAAREPNIAQYINPLLNPAAAAYYTP